MYSRLYYAIYFTQIVICDSYFLYFNMISAVSYVYNVYQQEFKLVKCFKRR